MSVLLLWRKVHLDKQHLDEVFRPAYSETGIAKHQQCLHNLLEEPWTKVMKLTW